MLLSSKRLNLAVWPGLVEPCEYNHSRSEGGFEYDFQAFGRMAACKSRSCWGLVSRTLILAAKPQKYSRLITVHQIERVSELPCLPEEAQMDIQVISFSGRRVPSWREGPGSVIGCTAYRADIGHRLADCFLVLDSLIRELVACDQRAVGAL
jgi:hypothetical protein